jgi:toxin YoeB
LRFSLAGKWSRRITHEHRLVYSVNDDLVVVYILALHAHHQL